MLTLEDYILAKNLLNYDPDTGIFTWRERRGRMLKGSVAGCRNTHGYYVIRIGGVTYKGHRLAWFITYAVVPRMIDHINQVKHDNRIDNLRICTPSQNQMNKNVLGVYWRKRERLWCAKIKINQKTIYLGFSKDKEKAIAMRRAGEQKYFKDFAPEQQGTG